MVIHKAPGGVNAGHWASIRRPDKTRSQGRLRAAAEKITKLIVNLRDAEASKEYRDAAVPSRPKPLRQLPGLRPDTQWPLWGVNWSFLDNHKG
mgnify:CR=1 FL=1